MEKKELFNDVEHIGIKTLDMEKAIKFYTEIIGFTLINRIKPGPVELVFLKIGNSVIELVEANEAIQCQDGVVNHLALHVSDIFAAVELLKANNTEFITPEPIAIGEGRYNFFFRGPSGEKIELFQG